MEGYVILAVLWVLCFTVLGIWIANQKNHNPEEGGLWGFLLAPSGA